MIKKELERRDKIMKLKLNFINDNDNSIYTLVYNTKCDILVDIKVGDMILLPNTYLTKGSQQMN